MPDAPTHYELLRVSRTASAAEIQRAFRNLAKTFHPDVNREPGAGPRFARIAAAYDVLSDEAKRREYDRSLIRKSRAAPATQTEADVAQGHYAWVSVAGAPARDAVDPSEIDEIYDTFFGSKAAPQSASEKSPRQTKPKTKRKRAS